MEVSEIYATYWRLHQHSRGQSSQRVRELIGQVEEEIRKFIFAARKYYFNSKSAGTIHTSLYITIIPNIIQLAEYSGVRMSPFPLTSNQSVMGSKTSQISSNSRLMQQIMKVADNMHATHISNSNCFIELKRHKILNWISKLPYQDAHINNVRKREQNTCGWLRKKKNFLSWMNSSTSRVLWVHGNGT